MNVLVTGDKGMIGSALVSSLLDAGYTVIGVDRTGEETHDDACCHVPAELADKKRIQEIVERYHIDRVIHLAALAHTEGEAELTWERYRRANVACSKNVFEAAGNRPVLFASTVDVYGFYDGKKPVDGNTGIDPVSDYGKSKAMAEAECKKLPHYTIFRLSPVYTENIKRDIQKRYYLLYPHIAYQIGKGSAYEVLNIHRAAAAMTGWCAKEPNNDIQIIKDAEPMWTPDCIKAEKAAGRARIVLRFPRWIVRCGYAVLKAVLGKNNKTFLINKALYPLRSSDRI